MENGKFKNKIITISGEPVTGKGTNVKALKEKLLKKGYKEENIHIITAGHEFRDYFNSIIDFIANIDDVKKAEELAEKEEIKTIMENKEYREKFTKAILKLKANNKKFNSTISIEQANNIPELADVRSIVDTIIDGNIEKKGIEINKEHRPEEVWIIDSRLAFKNIPNSFKVRLTCRPDVAGKRLLGDTSRGKEDNKYKDLDDAIDQREKRRIGEIKRYKERKGIDLTNEDNYDLIIDTSYSTVDDISDTILLCLDRYTEGKEFTKNWTSPITLVGTQFVGSTCESSYKRMQKEDGTIITGGTSLEDWIKFFKENTFNPHPDYALKVNEIDGIRFLSNGDGHHRNFGMVAAGKTLVPYSVIKGRPEGQSQGIWSGVQDHEMIIRYYPKKFGFQDSIVNSDFKYNIIYKNIMEVSMELDKKDKEDKEI